MQSTNSSREKLKDVGDQMSQFYRIKNFEKYQHSDHKKSMPWVKLWVSILDDAKFNSLSESAQLLFLKLLCLAGRSSNYFLLTSHTLRYLIPATKFNVAKKQLEENQLVERIPTESQRRADGARQDKTRQDKSVDVVSASAKNAKAEFSKDKQDVVTYQNENTSKTNGDPPTINNLKKSVVSTEKTFASPISTPGANFEQSILELWNSKMPTKSRGFFAKRRDVLEQAKNDEASLDYWSDVFDKVVASDFLTKNKGKQKLWMTTLEWVLEHHIEIMEGKYDNARKKTRISNIRTV